MLYIQVQNITVMNPFILNRQTISYVDDFLKHLRHVHNNILVKTYQARTKYGAILRIKIYRRMQGQWKRYSNNIFRVKCQVDLDILHGTLQHYQTVLQYMYDNINQTDSD